MISLMPRRMKLTVNLEDTRLHSYNLLLSNVTFFYCFAWLHLSHFLTHLTILGNVPNDAVGIDGNEMY